MVPTIEPNRSCAAIGLLRVSDALITNHSCVVAICVYNAGTGGVLIHRPQIRTRSVKATVGMYGCRCRLPLRLPAEEFVQLGFRSVNCIEPGLCFPKASTHNDNILVGRI